MYLVTKSEGEAARKEVQRNLGFGLPFTEDQVAKTEKLEIWGSEFKDPGPDFCEFRLFDKEGVKFATGRQNGY